MLLTVGRGVLALALAATSIGLATPALATVPQAAATEPVTLAVVVPLTVPDSASGLIPHDELARDTAPDGLLTRELDQLDGTSAVIGLDPMIAVSIRVLGVDAPTSALDWLARLRALPNEVFSLGYADADPASLAHVDALSLAAPVDFGYAIDPTDFGAAETTTPTPAPSSTTPAGTRPPLPSTAQLLDWPFTLPGIAWPADGTLLATDLPRLAAAGYNSVIVSSTNVSASSGALVDLSGIHGLVVDAGVSALVRAAVATNSDAAFVDAADRVGAALDGVAATSPGRTVIAALDRGWAVSGSRLPQLLGTMDARASTDATSLSSILASSATAATVIDGTDDAARTALIASATGAMIAEGAFATVLADPLAITAQRRADLLALLSVGWERGNDDWSSAMGTFVARSTEILGSVQVVQGSNISVFSNSTGVPITVSNALDQQVTVHVHLTSSSNILHVANGDLALTIEPDSSNKVIVPVEALTNGTVVATVTLTSTAGYRVGAPTEFHLDLAPAWETVGTLVIVVLLVLIFGGGIVRTFLKRRRARAAKSDELVAADAVGDAGPARD